MQNNARGNQEPSSRYGDSSNSPAPYYVSGGNMLTERSNKNNNSGYNEVPPPPPPFTSDRISSRGRYMHQNNQISQDRYNHNQNQMDPLPPPPPPRDLDLMNMMVAEAVMAVDSPFPSLVYLPNFSTIGLSKILVT